MSWRSLRDAKFEKRVGELVKKYRCEAMNAVLNLNAYMGALNEGANPTDLVKEPYVHNERDGVYALDQRGPVPKAKAQIRLYVWPDTDEPLDEGQSRTVHVITMGTKDTQKQDIIDSKDFKASTQKRQEKQQRENKSGE